MASVTRDLTIAAPPSRVWEVVTDPAERRDWLGGDLDVDLEPGSEGSFTRPGEKERPVRITDVEPGRRLEWEWEDGDDASTVHIRLHPVGPGTRVIVTERRRAAAVTDVPSRRPWHDDAPRLAA